MSHRKHTRRPAAPKIAATLALLGCCCLAPSAALAQTGPRLLLETFPKERTVESTNDVNLLEGGQTDNGEDFRLSVYESAGRVRLKPGVFESPRLGWEATYLELNSTDPDLPEQLVNTSAGFAVPLGKTDDWVFALAAGAGYAGDTPYDDGDAWYGQGTLLAFRQFDEESGLAFLIDYDGNRTFLPDVPLPGFAYSRRIRDDLFLVAGVPVTSLEWTPSERLTIKGTYALPYTVDLAVGYEVTAALRVYGKTESRSEAFHLDSLERNSDRMIFEQRRAEVGVAWEPRDGWLLTAGVGYAWGGEFSTGWDVRETEEVADISDEPYVKFGLVARF